MPDVPDAAFITVSPDRVCEVLSRSTEAVDRTEKLPVYAREGTRHVWLVNPTEKTLEVFRLEESRYLLVNVSHEDARVRAEPFDAIDLDLGLLWRG
jgi:Uma2 family endonuclease